MHRSNLPAVAGVLTPEQCRQTALSIAAAQESSGAIPWFDGGHTDPWDHVECAMALTAAGLLEPARAAFDWSRRTQRSDGSWPIQFRAGVIEDANSDSNFCAYIAAGVWHHVLVTGDESFAAEMWPVVHKAIDFVIDMQVGNGEIGWARSGAGLLPEALLTGCSSVFHSIRCALALAAFVGDPQPEWELALGRLGHALTDHPEAFTEKDRYSMDWYYPILGSALRGPAAAARIKQRWDDFVVDGLGIRCVGDRPWVTGAETCELVMALDALGQRSDAHRQFAAMQHLREDDGSYWTGLVFADGKRWPEERTTWTGAAMILAADAL
ncbi:prenyltransferase, partial [Mycobacterium sp.]